MSSDDLAPLLAARALLAGHFVLASGKHSGHYVQVARLGEQPRRLHEIIERALPALTPLRSEVVFSAAIGGIVVGQQLALHLGVRHIFAERKDNVMLLRRGFELRPGERVLLVEDVITTGGTLGEIRTIAEQSGAVITGVFSVINRSGRPDWQGIPVRACFAPVFPTYEPGACPLCAQGIPTERPGTKEVAP